jgi:hypothetical protein
LVDATLGYGGEAAATRLVSAEDGVEDPEVGESSLGDVGSGNTIAIFGASAWRDGVSGDHDLARECAPPGVTR